MLEYCHHYLCYLFLHLFPQESSHSLVGYEVGVYYLLESSYGFCTYFIETATSDVSFLYWPLVEFCHWSHLFYLIFHKCI